MRRSAVWIDKINSEPRYEIRSYFYVVLPGFEPRQAEPKTAVLPLHHKTILRAQKSAAYSTHTSKAMQR